VPLFALGAMALGIGSYACERASWPYYDAVHGSGEGPAPPRGTNTASQELSSSRLHLMSRVLEAAAVIALGGFLFSVASQTDRARSSAAALIFAMASYGVYLYLGLSVMDDDPSVQRRYEGEFKLLEIATLGLLLVSGLFGVTSKRPLGMATGLFAISAIALLIASAIL